MEVWNARLLVEEGNWHDVNEAAKSVRHILVRRLVNQSAIPLSRGIAYWDAVPHSWGSTSLFYIQNAPVYLFKQLTNPGESILTSLRTYLGSEWNRLGSRESGLLAYIVGRSRALQATFKHFAIKEASERRQELANERKQIAEQIGRLLLCGDSRDIRPPDLTVSNLTQPTTSVDSTSTKSFVSSLVSAVGINGSSYTFSLETPSQALATLQKALDQRPNVTKGQIPPWVIRWWPAFAAVVWGSLKLNGSWTLVARWLQNSVWGTCQLFWKNWVVDPLVEIYLTIRHDPTHQVALIAKESLSSDVSSLERMVVDFARDTDSGLSEDQLRAIGVAAAQGNVTPVMSVYEKQLSSPISNLVSGKLVRTLLIQVQKSKVDLEVALSGIDKLLSSQQLVFGLIAAIPALGVVWWLTRMGMSYSCSKIYGGGATNNERSAIFTSLQELDSVVQNAGPELSDEAVGLIFCEFVAISNNLHKKNSATAQQLRQSIDRLMKHAIEKDGNAVLSDLDRTYSRYMAVKLNG